MLEKLFFLVKSICVLSDLNFDQAISGGHTLESFKKGIDLCFAAL